MREGLVVLPGHLLFLRAARGRHLVADPGRSFSLLHALDADRWLAEFPRWALSSNIAT